MTRRTVLKLKPFAFHSDFSPQPKDDPQTGEAQVSMTAKELAALISQAKAEGAEEARAGFPHEAETRFQASAERLNQAMSDLAELIETLETANGEQAFPPQTQTLLRRVASRIIDGQRDLFGTN